MQTLKSNQDRSVNFVFEDGTEARYVRRSDDYIIVYLSSHTGCGMACRFCHLTQTKQTQMMVVEADGFLRQAETVLQYYASQVQSGKERSCSRVHFNFMARGEPMLNPVILNEFWSLSQSLAELAAQCCLDEPVFNISTIMPTEMSHEPHNVKVLPLPCDYPVNIFYSLYSLSGDFRKRWLPKAMNPFKALRMLQDWSDTRSNRGLVLHWALIEGENDSERDAEMIAMAVTGLRVKARFNLVRYNPYSEAQGKEPSEETIQTYFDIISQAMTVPGSRIVPRVGFDIAASCGVFIFKKKETNDPEITQSTLRPTGGSL